MMCVASLCGYQTYSAMAEWGRHYGAEFLQTLGFTRKKSSCKATLWGVLRRLEAAAVESLLSTWVETVLEQCFPSEETALAVDGKTLRGSKKQETPCFQLLAILGHRLGVCLHPRAILGDGDDKSHEITTFETLLDDVFRQGRLAGRI
jgi:hypothetical protein